MIHSIGLKIHDGRLTCHSNIRREFSIISINHITLQTQKIREVAMSDSLDDDDRRYRPVTLSRKYLRSRDSAYALKTLESMSREDLVRAFVKIQTSFVGGRSRSGGLEALVTCGGT